MKENRQSANGEHVHTLGWLPPLLCFYTCLPHMHSRIRPSSPLALPSHALLCFCIPYTFCLHVQAHAIIVTYRPTKTRVIHTGSKQYIRRASTSCCPRCSCVSLSFPFLYPIHICCRSGAHVAARFEADWGSPDAVANLAAALTDGTTAATTGAPQDEEQETIGRSTAPANDAQR